MPFPVTKPTNFNCPFKTSVPFFHSTWLSMRLYSDVLPFSFNPHNTNDDGRRPSMSFFYPARIQMRLHFNFLSFSSDSDLFDNDDNCQAPTAVPFFHSAWLSMRLHFNFMSFSFNPHNTNYNCPSTAVSFFYPARIRMRLHSSTNLLLHSLRLLSLLRNVHID